MGVRRMRVTGEALTRMCLVGAPRALEVIEHGLPHDVTYLGVQVPDEDHARYLYLVLSSETWCADDTEPEIPATIFRTWVVPEGRVRA